MLRYGSDYSHLHGEIIVEKPEIDKRIGEMAVELVKRYNGQNPLFVGLLEGAVHFGSRVMSAISLSAPASNPELKYMDVKTYGDQQEATETMIIQDLGPNVTVHDRPIIIIDDITDSGTTVQATKDYLIDVRGASHVEFVALLDRKKPGVQKPVPPDQVGFTLENESRWLVGMGLDDPKLPGGRWFPYVAVALNQPEEN